MNVKPICIIAGLATMLLVACNPNGDDSKNAPVTISKNIEYDVSINNYKWLKDDPIGTTSLIWYRNNIEASQRMAFIEMLFEKVLSGKLNITDMQDKAVDSANINQLFSYTDTVREFRPYPPFEPFDTIETFPILPEYITGMRFRENWTYNPITMAITKKVLAFAPIMTPINYNPDGNIFQDESSPLFWIICDSNITQTEVLTKRIMYNTSFAGDYLIAKNLDSISTTSYFSKLLELIYLDSIPAYVFNNNNFADSLISGKDLRATLNPVDTIHCKKSNPPFDEYDSIIKENLGPGTVFRFLEEWNFDINTFAITKTVVGVCSVRLEFDEEGEWKGYRPLFWVYFNDIWQPYKGKYKLKKKS
jgi:hypothetical protein